MSDRIQEVAERANVPEEFVRQLVAADALVGEEGELELAGAVRRVRLLRSWTAAGLSVETILTLVNRGALSLAFLDAPVMALPERLDCSYEQLATDAWGAHELPTGAPPIARFRPSGIWRQGWRGRRDHAGGGSVVPRRGGNRGRHPAAASRVRRQPAPHCQGRGGLLRGQRRAPPPRRRTGRAPAN